jgi:adenylate cyclase
MITEKYHILYVDDEEHNLNSFHAAFRKHYTVHKALNAREGLRILREFPVSLIVTDQRMPEMTGVQFLEAVIPEYPDPIRMILTGFSDIEAIIKAINTGRVYRYITKPWDENELKMTMDSALEYFALQQRNRDLMTQLQEKIEEQERIMKLFERYVPENIVREALKTGNGSIFDGESRIVSVLFCDIRDFTSISSGLDPKVVVNFLNDYFSVMTACVRKQKGSVNKFIGDGILAIFGAPLSYIDNQHNAVLSAIDMKASLQAINEKYESIVGRMMHIGIGINTGEVVAGNVGSEDRVEYTVIGDTVNVAARIEGLTRTNLDAILISESTHAMVRDVVDAKQWPAVPIKGKSEPISVYEVLGMKG